RVVAGEGLAEGVNRRRADIAVDNTDCADDELVQRPLGVAVRGILWRLGFGGSSRGDAHALRFKLDRLRLRIPCTASEDLGRGRAPLALPFRPRNRRGQRRKARL